MPSKLAIEEIQEGIEKREENYVIQGLQLDSAHLPYLAERLEKFLIADVSKSPGLLLEESSVHFLKLVKKLIPFNSPKSNYHVFDVCCQALFANLHDPDYIQYLLFEIVSSISLQSEHLLNITLPIAQTLLCSPKAPLRDACREFTYQATNSRYHFKVVRNQEVEISPSVEKVVDRIERMEIVNDTSAVREVQPIKSLLKLSKDSQTELVQTIAVERAGFTASENRMPPAAVISEPMQVYSTAVKNKPQAAVQVVDTRSHGYPATVETTQATPADTTVHQEQSDELLDSDEEMPDIVI